MESSSGSDEGPDEIIDLSSSDLSSDDQPARVMAKVDDTEDIKSGEEIEKKRGEEEVQMQSTGAVDNTEGSLKQGEDSQSRVNRIVETDVSVGSVVSASEVELTNESVKQLSAQVELETTAESVRNIKTENAEEGNNAADLRKGSILDQNEESVEEIKTENAAETKSTVEAENGSSAEEPKAGSVGGSIVESTEEVNNRGVLGMKIDNAEDMISTDDLRVKATSASSVGEVLCGDENVVLPGERDSSVTEASEVHQEKYASVEQEGKTSDLQVNDVSEEEVVIRRMTVDRSEAAVNKVESSNENVCQTFRVGESPDSDLARSGQQSKVANNLHHDHKVVQSQESEVGRTGELASEHADRDYPTVGKQESGKVSKSNAFMAALCCVKNGVQTTLLQAPK